ncbi:hypothetical protein [Hymenobacter lapidiphilus]|uniref:Uncharacterized protein n=1 Tax=Hymenobacter lapidiphilus TaxID=2608003 RepID=A0A7Y7PSZ9_9BACT|nr:hypothetical protein [Hymenobacter lapidiphilus]NVO33488.1 hypothetical protein [Hymenobacter lapidiphilus]
MPTENFNYRKFITVWNQRNLSVLDTHDVARLLESAAKLPGLLDSFAGQALVRRATLELERRRRPQDEPPGHPPIVLTPPAAPPAPDCLRGPGCLRGQQTPTTSMKKLTPQNAASWSRPDLVARAAELRAAELGSLYSSAARTAELRQVRVLLRALAPAATGSPAPPC